MNVTANMEELEGHTATMAWDWDMDNIDVEKDDGKTMGFHDASDDENCQTPSLQEWELQHYL